MVSQVLFNVLTPHQGMIDSFMCRHLAKQPRPLWNMEKLWKEQKLSQLAWQ